MAKKKSEPLKLALEDYEPLLVAISSRAVDTCLQGARCLALLEDPRAFGLLMQLSREDDAEVRLETCQALAQLGDGRALGRLCTLLQDEHAKVRDAAYTAIEKISKKLPLLAAEYGLAASFEDVRRRGLETLVRFAKKVELLKSEDPASQLLKQALSDSIPSVRMEAFKYVLNAKVGGGQDATLRFLLSSVHADVRREVLNEVIAEDIQLWSETMMFELLSDPDQGIRGDAFAFLKKKYKNGQTGWLSEALRSQHVDIRLQACECLIQIGNITAQAVLAAAIQDPEAEIRELALQSLIAKRATDSLVVALESTHVGVRLAAAKALANNGDERCKQVLLNLAGELRPEKETEQLALWESQVCDAVDGLLMLGDSDTVEFLTGLCNSPNANVRAHAAAALRWTADVDSSDWIRPLHQHEDANVSLPAAMASALQGDLIAARRVLSPLSKDSPLSVKDQLLVAIALGEETENQLVQMLDVADITLANSALIVLLCRDWLSHDGTPARAVAALAARDARIRLVAAQAMQGFATEASFADKIKDVFNDRSEEDRWQIDMTVVRKIAELMVFSKPHVQCRAVSLLARLSESKQEKWDFGWQWFSERFESELTEASEAASSKKLPKITVSQETLDQLGFGTLVGLSREQGGFHFRKYRPRFGWSVENIRLAALRRLFGLAESSDSFHRPTISVLTHACSGPWESVRNLAFELLESLGVEESRRAEIGIGSGQFDLAIKGLSLLTSSASAAKRKSILQDAILNQRSKVALEAAKMLRAEAGSVKTCDVCLSSADAILQRAAVNWVAEDYQEQAAAKKRLRALAADSAPSIRSSAIKALVDHRDEQAFDTIVSLLNDPDPQLPHQACYPWLLQLRDPKTPGMLLGLLEDPDRKLNRSALLGVVAEFRDPSSAELLIRLLDRKEMVPDLVKTITAVSGFDQSILDPNDVHPDDRDWMSSQHPRHGKLLADLMDRAIELGWVKRIQALIPGARWCLTDEVNAVLGRLCSIPDPLISCQAIEALGFRGEKRGASVEVLKAHLASQRDPLSQFLAAEGLARSGIADGIQVLMSAVEMMEDLEFRRRAVLAIGRLADERGLELLLQLVSHDGHALQDDAAEAIGYLGRSRQKEKIFGRLSKLVAKEGTAGTRAIIGLRHMDTAEAWDLIRAKSKVSSQSLNRVVVIQQLGYSQSDATQDLLLYLLERQAGQMTVALTAARRSFGLESVAPDIAFLKGRRGGQTILNPLELECLERVCEKATPAQILDLVSWCPLGARERLANSLLLQDELPIKDAEREIESPNSPTVALAARIIGGSAGKKHSKKVSAALESWSAKLIDASQRMRRQGQLVDAAFERDLEALFALVYAAGRVGGCEKSLLRMVTENSSSAHFARLRFDALTALNGGKINASMMEDLNELLQDYDPKIRQVAAELLIAQSKSKPDQVMETLLTDRFSFDSVVIDPDFELGATQQVAAQSAHYQPRVLLRLVKARDFKTLIRVAEDAQQDLNSRLGAIEGLAKMADKEAEEALAKLGRDSRLEELRKAAWRGLRRSKRMGAK